MSTLNDTTPWGVVGDAYPALAYTIVRNADTDDFSLYLLNPADPNVLDWYGDYFSYRRAEDAAHALIYQGLQRGILVLNAVGDPVPLTDA